MPGSCVFDEELCVGSLGWVNTGGDSSSTAIRLNPGLH